MKEKKSIIEYLSKTENPYQLKVEDMIVGIEYSENNKSFNECMLNVLNLKLKCACPKYAK